MNCYYKAESVSRKEIRQYVRWLKRKIGMENELYFPVVQFLENVLPILIPDFQFEVAPIPEMENKHGETFPDKNFIRIREDVYLRAVLGKGRDRLTIAHEIGHLLMHGEGTVSMCRLEHGETLRSFEDPEWQANAFGGELLASSYLIKGMSVSEVQKQCGVSASAARVQLNSIN